MNKDTIEKLTKLRLPGMLHAYQEQSKMDKVEDLTFEQRLTLMVDAEIDSRHNHMIEELSSNQYIEQGLAIHIVGATGSGKTYLTCALGNAACLAEKKVMYIRLPDLLTDLALGREQGNYKKILKRYEKVDLLIIDEWLLIPANDIAQQHILEIVERRNGKKGTIFCSQFTTDSWHQRLGGGALADAILDRILSKSKTIQIHGDRSMRNR